MALTKRKARVFEKNTHKFAGPEAEPIRQGEGGTNLAFLGTVRPPLQDGNVTRSLPDGERERRRTGNRWADVRTHRGKLKGRISEADAGGTRTANVPAHASAEEGNSQGREQSSCSFDSRNS